MRSAVEFRKYLIWLAIALAGAIAFGVVAAARGETVGAVWLIVAATSVYLLAYRFYARFLAKRVLAIDPTRPTPAVRMEDGLDYVPTASPVLFGHHFAAIAGAGPLVGPVLAAQMGYMPATLWLLLGVVLAGAVQDMVILFLSTRRDGRSLGEMIREELGPGPGAVALFGVLLIMVILLAVLALIVVKALAHSPWATFTVAATMPIALFMGLYSRFVRPGRILEVSAIGALMLLAALIGGEHVARDPALAAWFTLDGQTLALLLIGYGFVASALPVWLLLAPRDYLSTFLKIGTILLLAIGIVVVMPDLRMPGVTRFIDGTGPVFSGSLFPFLFITIACGAVSGFHALIASGTTPKMIASESDIPAIGYGAMLCESFVALMALIAACVIDPALYFAMNSPAAVIGTDAASAAAAIANWGFVITPDALDAAARSVGETTLLSRAGGAPTLAVGMAQILSHALGGQGMMAFWYHFAILFEALFILTTVDAGTRVARFMIQDLGGMAIPAMRETRSWAANLSASAVAVALWGLLLYQGVSDPLGGVNTLWPLFGISNQMLAAIALTLGTVVLASGPRPRTALVTALPAAWLCLCTLMAGAQKLLSDDPAIGFVAQARRIAGAIGGEGAMPPAIRTVAEAQRVVMNNWIDAGLCLLLMAIVVTLVGAGAMRIVKTHNKQGRTI